MQYSGKERGGVVQLRQYPLFASSTVAREPLYFVYHPGKAPSKKSNIYTDRSVPVT
jgi:hypothetical protein